MKPFKVTETPATNVNETHTVPAAPPGKQILESKQTGNPLPPSSGDVVDHNPVIPWPQPALGVDRLPYKNTK